MRGHGFSLVELLIMIAVIAIIAAIAIPNLITAKMAATEAGTITALRLYGSAQNVYALINSARFGSIDTLVNDKMLDERWSGRAFDGYSYASPTADGDTTFLCDATPLVLGKTGRYNYRITTDQKIVFTMANTDSAGSPVAMPTTLGLVRDPATNDSAGSTGSLAGALDSRVTGDDIDADDGGWSPPVDNPTSYGGD